MNHCKCAHNSGHEMINSNDKIMSRDVRSSSLLERHNFQKEQYLVSNLGLMFAKEKYRLCSWATMHRVCSSESKVHYLDITAFFLLFSLQAKPNQCYESSSNGSCTSEQLVPTQRSSSFQNFLVKMQI